MKKLFYLLGLATLLFACSEDEIMYSCDPEIDAIVKSGEIESDELSLSEFLEYDLVLQKALYRSFTTEKQKSFWLEKLDSIMLNELETAIEIAHVDSLRCFIESNYGLDNQEQKTFENNWIDFSHNTLQWDDVKINFIVNSLCITKDNYHMLTQPGAQSSPQPMGPNDCGCSTESDYCSQQGGDCVSGNCNLASIGCGWLLQYDCNGACAPY